ncbi:MAG: hypothetical protein CVU65_05895 [Deltaproteobacteria bacterium HGW-Deltaproteobacteria-22]|nr:MAG: hypothetical protein CVU65_05895 [Deltaproteobacteria bacterium HGW-Deltaproteobacteria-22]
MNLLLSLLLVCQTSQTSQTSQTRQTYRTSWPRAVVAYSVVPGLVWPGAGHFCTGDDDGAKKLSWWGLAGLGLAAAGGIPLMLTNSSRHATWLPVSALWLGAGTFVTAKLADWFGTALGGTGARAAPTPPWEVQAGLLWTDDPLTDVHALGTLSARTHWRNWHAAASAELAPSGEDRRLLLRLGRRFGLPAAGSTDPAADAPDGSFWEASAGVSDWRFGEDPVRLTTFELWIEHRRDLAGVHPTLAGSFVQAGLGFGLEFAGYPGMDTFGDRELSRLALGYFEYGVFLGQGAGEVAFYYDQRHDTRAGGLMLHISGDGPAGAVGLRGRHRLTGRRGSDAGGGWFLTWDAARGAHWVVQLGLGWQGGSW